MKAEPYIVLWGIFQKRHGELQDAIRDAANRVARNEAMAASVVTKEYQASGDGVSSTCNITVLFKCHKPLEQKQ